MAQEKAEVVQALIEVQLSELNYHRKREANAFSMTTSIFYAISGFWLVKNVDLSGSSFMFSNEGRLLVSLLVVLTALFSHLWQAYHFERGKKHKQVIARAWMLQGVFDLQVKDADDHGVPLMHFNWDRWGNHSAKKRYQSVKSKVLCRRAATLYLGMFTVAIVWLTKI